MMVRILVSLCVLVTVTTLSVGCGGSGGGPDLEVDGSYKRVTLQELVKLSPLVVRGTAISDTVRSFDDAQGLSDAAKAEARENGLAAYHDVRVRVREYLKGRGPRVISVMRRARGGGTASARDIPSPDIDRDQVLFLFPGRGPFTGGYLINGPEAVADVQDSRANFPLRLASGERVVSLARLRAIGQAD